MADTDMDPTNPIGIDGLAMLPTGSGVVDLEIAREQAALAGDRDADDEAVGDGVDTMPTEEGRAAEESAAQPS